jgi:transcription elongation factor GreA
MGDGAQTRPVLQFVSMPVQILLSQSGFAKLKQELEELKGPVRTHLAKSLREAKAHGDLRENAAYHEAKLNQARIEGRIADLEKVLLMARVVDRPRHAGETAHLGSVVRLRHQGPGGELTVTLVGSFEADPIHYLISITSPLGAALIGREPGDVVEVEAPAGVQRYEVLSVAEPDASA